MILIRLLLKVFIVVSVLSVLIHTVYETLKIMHDILREIYFDTVSEGKENISSVFGIM